MADPESTSAPSGSGSEGTSTTTPQPESASPGQLGQEVPASSTAPEETFFDPSSLSPELMPAYKQMQGAFTKKTQAIKASKDKIAAYDAFMQNPQATIQQLASQYGLQIQQPGRPQQQGNGFDPNWQPNSWQEVFSKVEELVAPRLRQQWEQELQPILGEFRNIKRSQIERTLDEHAPEWRQYEDEMSSLLQSHPSLVNDPDLLARLAIPSEAVEGRAMQKALAKLQKKGEASQVSGGSTTSRQQSVSPDSVKSFDEAVAFAKKQLAEQGIKGP